VGVHDLDVATRRHEEVVGFDADEAFNVFGGELEGESVGVGGLVRGYVDCLVEGWGGLALHGGFEGGGVAGEE
jgi:hypothetical protein